MSELIGTRVAVPGQARGYGILKYIGPIEGKTGTFGGIELQGPVAASRGKNSGAVDGVQYFEVSQPMTGLFLPWDRLRTVNTYLPLFELSRAGSVVSRNSDVRNNDLINTPSPPNRRGLRLSTIGRADSMSRTTSSGRESPHLGNLAVNIQKRHLAPREFGRPATASLSVVGSRNSLGDLFERTRQVQLQDTAALQSELHASRIALDASTNELHEKNGILLELQRTVDELSPILGDYENALSEKDNKLKKQRQEYDRAREEWRQSLDLMLSAQQQAENLYEQQIEDLKEEVTKLTAKGFQEEPAAVVQLQSRLEETLTENARLTTQLQLQLAKAIPSGDNDLEFIQQLEKKISMLTQDVSSVEIVLQDSQKRNKQKDARIAELEIELEELKEDNVKALLKGVDSLSVDDWIVQEQQLKKQIAELEHQVAEHKGKENELPKLVDVSKLTRIEADLESRKVQVEAQATKIAELQKAIQDASTREKELEKAIQDASSRENELQSSPSEASDARLLNTIDGLKHELNMRPSFDELTELQMALDEVERLHANEISLKENELTSLQQENNELRKKMEEMAKRAADTEALLKTPLNRSPVKNVTSAGPFTHSGTESWAKNDSLPIYSPQNRADPSSGRNDWCGLCERDGHSSLNCPYENDIF